MHRVVQDVLHPRSLGCRVSGLGLWGLSLHPNPKTLSHVWGSLDPGMNLESLVSRKNEWESRLSHAIDAKALHHHECSKYRNSRILVHKAHAELAFRFRAFG